MEACLAIHGLQRLLLAYLQLRVLPDVPSASPRSSLNLSTGLFLKLPQARHLIGCPGIPGPFYGLPMHQQRVREHAVTSMDVEAPARCSSRDSSSLVPVTCSSAYISPSSKSPSHSARNHPAIVASFLDVNRPHLLQLGRVGSGSGSFRFGSTSFLPWWPVWYRSMGHLPESRSQGHLSSATRP